MRKFIVLFLAIILSLSFTACDENDDQQSDTSSNTLNIQGNMPGVENETTNQELDSVPSIDNAQVLKSGSCGDNATFKLYDNGVLVINGTGSVASDNPFDTYGDHLKYVRIDAGITEIKGGAFRDIDSISIVELPNTLKTIGNYAFGECFGLKIVNFPNGLERIGENAFYITNIKSIVLPSTITEIGKSAFSHNDSLKNIVFPSTITEISERAFSDCSELETVMIPGNVKTIKQSAFQNCESLKTVILCEGVKTIEFGAFYADRIKDRNMAIPDSVTNIEGSNLDYRTKIYCNEGSVATKFSYTCDIDTVIGYDGFVKNYDLP